MELSGSSCSFVSKQTIIAYWLIPSEPARSFFRRIIDDLARRYDAPFFEPHVTIHVAADHRNAAENALSEGTNELVRLVPLAIDHSDKFIKTLFVQFATSAELRKMNAVISEETNDATNYELKPHLSLLYKNLSVAIRRELAASIKVPFSEILFDSLQAVRCVSPTQCRADIECWQMVASRMMR